MQNVIKHGMAEVTTSTKITTEPMRAERVNICSTVITKVRDAKWGSQTKANGYVNSGIIQRRPREIIRRVCNQEPDSFLEADKSLALDKDQGQWLRVQLQWKKPLVDPTISVDVT